MSRTMGVAAFRKACTQMIAQVAEDRQPVTITKHGRPVAVLSPTPAGDDDKPRIIGAMRGSVSRYDDPFAPAVDPSEWEALQ